jgi:hypothetical protein
MAEGQGNRMGFVQREIDKINLSLGGMPHGPRRDELYAAQQALAWSLDPLNFESPLAMIGRFDLNTREGSEGCPGSSDLPNTDPRNPNAITAFSA